MNMDIGDEQIVDFVLKNKLLKRPLKAPEKHECHHVAKKRQGKRFFPCLDYLPLVLRG